VTFVPYRATAVTSQRADPAARHDNIVREHMAMPVTRHRVDQARKRCHIANPPTKQLVGDCVATSA